MNLGYLGLPRGLTERSAQKGGEAAKNVNDTCRPELLAMLRSISRVGDARNIFTFGRR